MQKNQLLFIVSLVFAIIVTLFALTNANPVVINLFFYKVEASQAVIIFFSAALGAIVVTALGLIRDFKLKSEVKKLRKENDALNKKIQELQETQELQESSQKIQKEESTDDLINKDLS